MGLPPTRKGPPLPLWVLESTTQLEAHGGGPSLLPMLPLRSSGARCWRRRLHRSRMRMPVWSKFRFAPTLAEPIAEGKYGYGYIYIYIYSPASADKSEGKSNHFPICFEIWIFGHMEHVPVHISRFLLKKHIFQYMSKYVQICPTTSKYVQMRSNTSKYVQIRPNKSK